MKHISLALGGSRVIYDVVTISETVDPSTLKCASDGHAIEFVATVMQMGFWEDHHFYFSVCTHCGKPTVFVQELPLAWEVIKDE